MKKLMMASFMALFTYFNGYTQADETPYVPGEIIIMLEKGASPDHILKSYSHTRNGETGVRYAEQLCKLSNIHLFRFDESAIQGDALLRNIRSNPHVRAAQFNHYVKQRATTPNDEQFGSQWHHNNIQSQLAWDITTGGLTANGDEIVVAVIETANYNHNDLIANHWVNSAEIPGNGVDDDGNGYVDDVNGWNPVSNNDNVCCGGHGTAVNGMIGAKGNNGIGGSGVNWDVKIMNVEVGSLTESNVIASYSYPYTMRNLYNTTNGAQGAFVVATNASWGIDFANPNNYPVWCAYYDDLGSVGILNCGATANNNVNIDNVGDMPTGCGSDYMVSVTATNSSDQRTFSGFGINSINLAAPGSGVLLPSGGSSYSSTSGTSFASPCVAGAIALLYSAPCESLAAGALVNPQATADAIRGFIYDGVDQTPQLLNETTTGGRLNVWNALNLALDNCGPPPVCEPKDITLTAACVWNSDLNEVDAQITIEADFDSNLCNALTVCYGIGSSPSICLDLAQTGGSLNNDNSYTITGLAPGTTYSVQYNAADGSSAVQQITTPSCNQLVAGCTDPDASNFNPNADIDNGSCQYPCANVTLSLTTDCWGNEVSWEIVNENDEIIASVASGTYGNEDGQTFTWTGCLDNGCYTFNIFDTFGDGMNGSSYSFCGIDGTYSIVNDDDGEVLVQMGNPDYGSGTSHTFCVENNVIVDPEPAPCAMPYPQVTGLTRTIQPTGVLLSWTPILGSLGCEIQGGPANFGGVQTVQVLGPDLDSFFIPNGQFPVTDVYQVRVRCGCSLNPVVVGSWSAYTYFFIQRGKIGEVDERAGSDKTELFFNVFPNPTSGELALEWSAQGQGLVEIFDLFGKNVFMQRLPDNSVSNRLTLDLRALSPAVYMMRVIDGQGKSMTRRIVVSK